MKKEIENPKAIVFDLDGTLIDSAPDIAMAVNKVLDDIGHDPLTVEYVEGFIGGGSKSMLNQIFKDLYIAHDDAFLDQKLNDYLEYYRNEPAKKTQFYPSVREDLQELADLGFKLGICTNKPQAMTEVVLEAIGIRHLFSSVFGADAVENCKPHRDHLLTVVSDLGVDQSQVYYIGDTEIDRACSHSADVSFFLVNWGGGKELPIIKDRRLARLSQIVEHCSPRGLAQS